MSFAPHLISWYDEDRRLLPWRETRDPYKIWISEVILQQTRVAQGLSYYMRFVEKFPDVKTLARSSEQEVLKLWQGLGYYSRARNLRQAAIQIVERHEGIFPVRYQDILSLKGVGEYTAAAIASIAYGEPLPVIDGNVIRVMTRLFDIDRPGRSSEVIGKIRDILNGTIPHDRPGDFNQAMMEFGARICVPKNPACEACFLKDICKARKAGTVPLRPFREEKAKSHKRYFNYFVFLKEDNEGTKTIIRKRSENDIWKNLYDFPAVETTSAIELEKIMDTREWQNMAGDVNVNHVKSSETYHHKLSHQDIIARFHVLKIRGDRLPECAENLKTIFLSDIQRFPVSRLIERYLRDEDF